MSLLSNFARSGAIKVAKNCLNVTNQARALSTTIPQFKKKEIELTFVTHNGKHLKTKGEVGDNFLNVVIKNNLPLEGYGACEGTLTCSTCHLILKQEDFDKLPEEPESEEIDMLELAQDVTDTSRLGCQVYLTEDMDGIVVRVPENSDIRLESEKSTQ